MAVLGLSVSPERVPGLAAGDEFAGPPVPVFGWDEVLRGAGVVFRAVLVTGVPVGLFAVLGFEGDPWRLELPGAGFAFAGVGVLFMGPPSSNKTWLPALLPRLLSLGLVISGFSPIVPLAARLLGRGVSLSMCSWGIGNGLDVNTGILELLFLSTGLM
jgi:hypothetical protein